MSACATPPAATASTVIANRTAHRACIGSFYSPPEGHNRWGNRVSCRKCEPCTRAHGRPPLTFRACFPAGNNEFSLTKVYKNYGEQYRNASTGGVHDAHISTHRSGRGSRRSEERRVGKENRSSWET